MLDNIIDPEHGRIHGIQGSITEDFRSLFHVVFVLRVFQELDEGIS